jgi:hypothetical protein
MAEPDYGGRIDHPAALAEFGALQAAALRRQGADPQTGRRLLEYFHQAGLQQPRAAVIGGQWGQPPSAASFETEWQMLAADLAGAISPAQLQAYKEQDAQAWQSGERILYIPTFYAWGFAGSA